MVLILIDLLLHHTLQQIHQLHGVWYHLVGKRRIDDGGGGRDVIEVWNVEVQGCLATLLLVCLWLDSSMGVQG